MSWPPWKKLTRRPERVAIRLRNGKTAWVYPGERIIDRTREKGVDKNLDVYVGDVLVGQTRNRDIQRWRNMVSFVAPCQLDLEFGSTSRLILTPLHVDGGPELVRAVIGELDRKECGGLAEAARTFEKAINAEPGVTVEVVPAGARDIHAAITHTKWAVKVARTKQEQVYP